MLDLTPASVPPWFSVDEVAEVAGVTVEEVWRLVALGQAVVFPDGSLVSTGDAVHLVRVLRGDARPSRNRVIFNQLPGPSRAKRRSVAASGLLGMYGFLALVFLLVNALGLMEPAVVAADIKKDAPVKLVYLMMPGPGGGGGGGGLHEPRPAPPARKKTETARKTPSRVPPARPLPAPPARPAPPRPEARVEPTSTVDKPVVPAPPAVQAPVQPIATDPLETVGLPNETPASAPSRGPGNGGGVGSGSGQGIGEGSGGGIGPGSGGGTGGGPYQPGAGIDPPTLVREVRPTYTDAARRQAIEGDVVLEIIVRQDGSVGNVRVLRSLGAGLEQKAIEAVRQWRFNPARRHGAPVDVVVQVAVEFKLR